MTCDARLACGMTVLAVMRNVPFRVSKRFFNSLSTVFHFANCPVSSDISGLLW